MGRLDNPPLIVSITFDKDNGYERRHTILDLPPRGMQAYLGKRIVDAVRRGETVTITRADEVADKPDGWGQLEAWDAEHAAWEREKRRILEQRWPLGGYE